jgi:trimeric autotransporter adhesin
MKRNIILALVLLVLMPTLASAGLIVPLVASGGLSGSISPSGSVFVVSGTKTYTLTAASGYTLNYVTNNGVTVPSSKITGTGPWTYVVPFSGSTQSVNVYFMAIPVQPPPPQLIASAPANVSAALNTPQSISGQTSTIANLQSGTKAKFKWTCIPATGAVFNPISSSVTSPNNILTTFTATVSGSYAATLTLTAPGATASTANVAISVQPAGIAGSSACLACHAGQVQANAYALSTHASFATSTCQACHNPTGTGQHPFNITSATVSPTTFTYISGGAIFCLNCHTPAITHKTPGMACATCHNNSDIHDPDTTFTAALNVCFTCHGAANSTHFYSQAQVANLCLDCHNNDGHNPAVNTAVVLPQHFNGYTSYANPSYAAAYVTPTTQCANCHVGGDPTTSGDQAIKQYRQDWAGSWHGDVNGTPWKNSASNNWKASGIAGAKVRTLGFASGDNDCQRCHTATGYVLFANTSSINPINAAAPKYAEPLTCDGCHNPDFSVRSVTARTGYYNYSSGTTGKLLVSYPYQNQLTSNICLGCHVGREAGATIQAMAAATAHKNYSTSFWQNVSFVNTHFLTGGGQVFGTTGYEYPGQTYSDAVGHSQVGAGLDGPCVTCHMPNASHTLDPSAAGYVLCNTCHEGAGIVNSSYVSAKTAEFTAALQALANALIQKGFTPNIVGGVLTNPYFTATNWGNEVSGPGNMGAAFNYNLLANDLGAFAHNPTYAKRLLRDSIDFLENGSVDRTRDLTATVDSLLPNPTDQANANAFIQYAANATASCDVCHSTAVDPQTGHNIVNDYLGSQHATQPGGAACSSCHAPSATVAHPPAQMFTDTADISNQCLTSGCHIYPPVAGYAPGPGLEHTWPSVGVCVTCHNGHNLTVTMPFPHLSNYSTAQFITTNFNNCTYCHNQTDQQGNVTFFVYSTHYEFARSGKGNATSPAYTACDFKTLGTPAPAKPANSAAADCVRCHTTTGYINYVSSSFTDIHAWGVSGLQAGGDRTREMIQCAACHNPTPFLSYDSSTSTQYIPAYSRRSVPPVTAFYNFSSAGSGRILNSTLTPDSGDSNICIVCHAGTVAGTTLQAIGAKLGATASFWSNTPFISAHYMTGAGILFQTIGFTYRSQLSYRAANGSHSALGDDFIGSCSNCHLLVNYNGTPDQGNNLPTIGKSHLFSPVSTASNGVIGKVTAYAAVCSECHSAGSQDGDWSNPANLELKREQYLSSLNTLAAVLAEKKGVWFNPNISPFFFTDTTYGTPFTNWGNMDTMGAAFNLQLLWSDAGGYTHNDIYAKRLIYDSIDYLDDGNFNNNTVLSTLQALDLQIVNSQNLAYNTPGFTCTANDVSNAEAYITPRP